MCICWWVSYVTDLEYDGEKKDIQWVRYHFSHARVTIVMSRDAICNRFRRHQQKLNRAIERWSRCCESSYLSPYDAWCCQPHRMGHRVNLKWIMMDGWMRHLCCVRNEITQALQWRFIYALTRMLFWYSFRSSLATRETSNNPDSKIHGSTWGPPGSCRPQVGPMVAQRTLLSGKVSLPWENEEFAHPVHTLSSICCIAIIIRRRVITWHYSDVIMGTVASQTTSLTIVYSTVYSDADQRKQQSSATLAFVRNSPGTGEFPAQMASNAENVSIWWRLHGRIMAPFTDASQSSASIKPIAAWGRNRHGWTLAQIKASCLMPPRHKLNQSWRLFSVVLWHSSWSNFTESAQVADLQNEFENYIFLLKLLPHLPGAKEQMTLVLVVSWQCREIDHHPLRRQMSRPHLCALFVRCYWEIKYS